MPAVLLILLLLTGACASGSGGASSPSPTSPLAAPADPSRLVPGVPLERELRPGEEQEYRLPLEAGWYGRIELEQVGIDVAARLIGPAGEPMAEADGPDGPREPEVLSWIAAAPGELRVRVSPRYASAPAGAYRIRLDALRPAQPGDAERVSAERALAEGRKLLDEGTDRALERARTRLEEALAAWTRATELGGPGPGKAGILLALSTALPGAEAERAQSLAEEALRLARSEGDRAREAASLLRLGDILEARNDLDGALAHYEQALQLCQDSGKAAMAASALYNLGGLFLMTGRRDLPQAARYYEEALPLRRQTGDLAGEAFTLSALAATQLNLGETEAAFAGLEQALTLASSISDPAAKATALYNLGRAYKRRGDLDASAQSFEQALDLNRQMENWKQVPTILHALGSLHVDLGDLDKALQLYGEALEQSRRLEDQEQAYSTLHSMGTAYLQKNPRKALELARQALDLAQEHPQQVVSAASALHTAGNAHLALGQPTEALLYLKDALAIRLKGKSPLEQAQVFRTLGSAYRDSGDAAKAEESFRSARDLSQRSGSTLLEAHCLYEWARLDRKLGRPGEALDKVRVAIGHIEQIRSRVVGDFLRTAFFASKREFYELFLELLMEMERGQPGQGHAEEALEASERARARALLELLAESRLDVKEGIDSELKESAQKLETRLSWLQDQIFRAPDKAAAFEEELVRTEEELKDLETEIRRQHPRYAEVRYPAPLDVGAIQSLLESDTALVEYFLGSKSSFVFVVTREAVRAYPLAASGGEIAALVKEFLETLKRSGRKRMAAYQAEAAGLYDLLLGPAAPALAGKERLLIAPDAALHLLPFEVLLTGPSGARSYADLPYLLHRHAISYIPSASVLAGLREPRSEPPSEAGAKQFLAFANPIYGLGQEAAAGAVRGGSPHADLPQLPGTEDEVRAIAALYPADGVEVYLGADATEERVKATPALETARLVHFATHGTVHERFLLSALMLTRSPSSREDGMLQVYEIFNLRLGADLVVLSACDTALGTEVTGEGMLGLTRAFLYAGARGLLVSLWPAVDRSTPELMASFYRHLGSSGSKADALRKSKIEMIRGGRYAEPYSWAPFILTGDPD